MDPASTPLRPTIGLILGDLLESSIMTWGALDAARHRANVLCWQGQQLNSPIGYQRQANILYDLISPQIVDGLAVWTGWLGQYVGEQAVGRFLRRFDSIPVVSIAQQVEGFPSLLIDNYQSMQLVVKHLLDVHRCRRIAFVSGPADHPESEERYRAFSDTLVQYGIAPDPRLTVAGQFKHFFGESVVAELLDERQADFEAIVTCDDYVAIGVVEALQSRGIRVPHDVAVVGFDDVPEARHLTPPLTTVHQPGYDQGYRAVKMILELLNGHQVPECTFLPTRLVVRQSCGCLDPIVVKAYTSYPLPPERDTTDPDRCTQAIWEAVRGSVEGCQYQHVEQLTDSFWSELHTDVSGRFLATLDHILQNVAEIQSDLFPWQDVISQLREQILPNLGTDRTLIHQAESLLAQARILVGEIAVRKLAQQGLKAGVLAQRIHEMGQALSTAFSLTDLTENLCRALPGLGIPGCFVSLYEQPRSEQAAPDQARLLLAYDRAERRQLAPADDHYSIHKLASDYLAARDTGYHMIVEPLYFREEQLGIALFEVSPQAGTLYGRLRDHLSAAIHGVRLFERYRDLYHEAQEARSAAEKADRLKTRLLVNVSHDLRTPLNVILGYTQNMLSAPSQYGEVLPRALLDDLSHILASGKHLNRLINDLLDLSRAEIGELDLFLEMLDPRALLEAVFREIKAHRPDTSGTPAYHLSLSPSLPVIQADQDRLRQILFNLLSNAQRFTASGEIVLGAEIALPHLHIWVKDTGTGIPISLQARIFDPFVTGDTPENRRSGIGLGLSITRRLVALHGGTMSLESAPGQGSTFHVYLPLPNLAGERTVIADSGEKALLVIAARGACSPALANLAAAQEWTVQCVRSPAELESCLDQVYPMAIAWDWTYAAAGDWALIQRVRLHPRLCQLPFLLFDQLADQPGERTPGSLTSVLLKPLANQTLFQVLKAVLQNMPEGPIMLVDDDPEALALYEKLTRQAFPAHPIRRAANGAEAIAILGRETPCLVVLDLMMPEVDGFEVLDFIRDRAETRDIPVIVISGKMLTQADIQRLNRGRVILHSKGILSDHELQVALYRVFGDKHPLEENTSGVVKQTLAFIHQYYAQAISRDIICQTIGVSEDYLSRIFHQELGISLVDYINRYRISLARQLLGSSRMSIAAVANHVGFNDPAYFSRVFARYVGVPPSQYRRKPPRPN